MRRVEDFRGLVKAIDVSMPSLFQQQQKLDP
jgi:hypothetical protein